jgi:hypothetical protein
MAYNLFISIMMPSNLLSLLINISMPNIGKIFQKNYMLDLSCLRERGTTAAAAAVIKNQSSEVLFVSN